MKKLLLFLSIVAATLYFGPNIVSAHTPKINASCQSGLSVNLTNYQSGNNKLKVYLDGGVVLDTVFHGSYSDTFDNPDKTVPHVWRVVIDAVDPNGAFDLDTTLNVAACVLPTTTTTTTTTTVTSTTLPRETTSTSTTPTTVVQTTAPVAPTTTAPATTITSSSSVPNTSVNPNTSTSAEVLPVTEPPTTAAVVTLSPVLLATGNASPPIIVVAFLVLSVGVAAIYVARKKTV